MSFFTELKRRNVLRVAIAYVAVAWLLIQVAETVFPAYGFTDAALRFVISSVAIGFIPVLMVSWVFELTPSGLRRDADVDRAEPGIIESGKRFDRIVLVVLALAVGYFAFDKFILDPVRDAEMVDVASEKVRSEEIIDSFGDKSIAVLPFVNMSPDPDQAYFADGIAEELLNLLAKVPALRVTSRSSSFQFRGDALDLVEVADKLNVAHILEGSVRKAGNEVRITVQLIEAGSDTHLWSETFDRPLDDIFAIQDEVSAQVVAQLRLTLLGEAPKAEQVNLDAYAAVLETRQIIGLQRWDDLPKAEEMLKAAIEIDSDYVDALNLLGLTYWLQARAAPSEAQSVLRDKMEEIRTRVLEIDPDNAAAKSAIAWDLHNNEGDLVEAAKLYEEAAESDPANTYMLRGAGVLASDLGRADLAVRMFEYLAERDPMTLWNYDNLGWAYTEAGRYEDALRLYAMGSSMSGQEGVLQYATGNVKLLAGDPVAAMEAFEQVQGEWGRLYGMAMALHDLGRKQESAEALVALEKLLDESGDPWPQGLARVNAWTGNNDEAFRYLRVAAEEFPTALINAAVSPFLKNLHDDPRWLPYLEETGRLPEQLAKIKFSPRLPSDL